MNAHPSADAMKQRTLVTHRRYFGVEALALREASGRVLARMVGLPLARSRVSGRQLRQDFNVTTIAGDALVDRLVQGGLLRPHPERQDDFQATPRMVEFASARVVEPLRRGKAKRLVERACLLAEKINAEWSRNPLWVVAIAPHGDYVKRLDKLSELPLGIVVGPRPQERRSRWRALIDEGEGLAEIRDVFASMSSFVVVSITDNPQTLPRPFSIAWQEPSSG